MTNFYFLKKNFFWLDSWSPVVTAIILVTAAEVAASSISLTLVVVVVVGMDAPTINEHDLSLVWRSPSYLMIGQSALCI